MTAIRQQINIAAPQRTVWNALTTAEGWTSWWADEARFEAREGGRVVLTTEGDDGNPVEERGILHEIRPTRRLEITWDNTSPAKTKGTRLQFTISRDGDETRLAMVHSGGGVLDDEEARDALEKEWRNGLRSLRETLEQK
ncbi:MAG: SRPBCC domain-containing protein [Myxococcales bacterium]|nr:SRPBCC domain-containing protein [Myxococcales bacterium]